MGWGNININGDANINLNNVVDEYCDDIIKLYTDDELKAELQKRKDGKSYYKAYIDILDDIYVCNSDVTVELSDVLYEIENDELIDEMLSRGLNAVNYIKTFDKYDLKKIICQTLNINEYYDDEEIFAILKEVFDKTKFFKS